MLLLLAVGAVVVLELGIRVRQWARYGTTSSFYAFELDPISGLRVPAPGVTEGRGVHIEINSLGFRGAPLESPKPAGRVRLAFLGGSTTFCAEATDGAHTWPERVAATLRDASPRATLDVVNAAAGGLHSGHSLDNLRHRVAPHDPDVVVIYHATNDLTFDARAQAVAAGLAKAEPEQPGWLERNSLAWQLVAKNLRARAPGGDEGALDFDVQAAAERFRGRLSALVDFARERADVVVLVTFAHRPRRGQEPEHLAEAVASSRFYMPWLSVEHILDGFDAYNRVIREVAAETGAILVAREDEIPGDAIHFVDSVHFTDAGCERQAERVAAALVRAPAWRALMDGGGG